MRGRKILILTNIIPPYRIPLFNRLNQGNFELKIIALAEKEENRDWLIAKEDIQFDYQILPGSHGFLWSKELPIHLSWGVFKALRHYDPDIVITSGYSTLGYWQALLFCKVYGKKYVLWNGTTDLSTGKKGGFIGGMKKFIIRKADSYITYGTKASEYLGMMGANLNEIYTGCNTVNMDKFRSETQTCRSASEFEKEREKYPDLLLLYVGQLIERKGITQILKALEKLNDPDIGLIIVGDGPKKGELQKFCANSELENIRFTGFIQQDELPKYYALADVLVLPSFEEVWGLVVNEALASGLYVLCSDRAGAAYDLIEEGWNGELFDPQEVGNLTKLIKEAKNNINILRDRRDDISEQAWKEFSIERLAQAFLNAIESVS